MIPNLWQLQYDPFPLTAAATAWVGVAEQVTATADRVVGAVRRVMGDAWESTSAESFDAQHRLIIAGLDGMASVAREIAGTLGAIAGELEATQQRLDQDWNAVKLVKHEFVGAERILLFWPEADTDTEKVNRGLDSARTIRGELDSRLYDNASALGNARATFESSRSTLAQVAAGASGGSEVNIVPDITFGVVSSNVIGQSQSGVAVLAPAAAPTLGALGPVSFSAPTLNVPTTSALAGGLLSPSALARALSQSKQSSGGSSMPMGGAGAGARGGASAGSRPGQSRRRSGPAVLRASESAAADAKAKAKGATSKQKVKAEPVREVEESKPRTKLKVKVDTKVWLGGEDEQDKLTKAQRDAEQAERDQIEQEAAEREAEKESKRAEIEERRAARAERRAARLAEAEARGA